MKDIAIYGTGGFGKEVACLLYAINNIKPEWNLIGFFDDTKKVGEEISLYGKVLGGYKELNNWGQPINVVVAIGTPGALRKVVERIHNSYVEFPNIIHPSFVMADERTSSLGKGNIITRDCYFSCDVHIGNHNILIASVAFGHDVSVGSFNTFMPVVRISGGTIIGDGNFFGVSSVVLQQLKIGNDTRIGAGSVIMTKTKSGELYMGNPAKKTSF